MSPSVAAQQTDITAITQFDGFFHPAADPLALAALDPLSRVVLAHVAVDQLCGEFAPTGTGMMPIQYALEH